MLSQSSVSAGKSLGVSLKPHSMYDRQFVSCELMTSHIRRDLRYPQLVYSLHLIGGNNCTMMKPQAEQSCDTTTGDCCLLLLSFLRKVQHNLTLTARKAHNSVLRNPIPAMDLFIEITSVIPYQLCTLCRKLFDRTSQDVFWDDDSYAPLEGIEVDQSLNRQILPAIAEPLLHHDSLKNLQESTERCHLCTILDGHIVYVHEGGTSLRSIKEADIAVRRDLQLPRQLYVHVSRDASKLNDEDCRPIWLRLAPTKFPWLCMNDWMSEVKMHRHRYGMQYKGCRDLGITASNCSERDQDLQTSIDSIPVG